MTTDKHDAVKAAIHEARCRAYKIVKHDKKGHIRPMTYDELLDLEVDAAIHAINGANK